MGAAEAWLQSDTANSGGQICRGREEHVRLEASVTPGVHGAVVVVSCVWLAVCTRGRGCVCVAGSGRVCGR